MRAIACAMLLLVASSCSPRAARPKSPLPLREPPLALVVGSRQVDILAVVDTSSSSILPSVYLKGYHELFGTLLFDPACGGVGDHCRVADIRVGVITGNLGTGPYSYHPSCAVNGDGARLRTGPEPYAPDCTLLRDPWLSFANGETNVPGSGPDPQSRFLQGFDCLAYSWLAGCTFQQPLEAARKALDPGLAMNRGFLRDSAFLAVAIVADDDDCSATRTELFSMEKGIVDQLGLLSGFRCTETGLDCDDPLGEVGEKHNCKPGQDWLVKVDEYVQFLRTLRPGRALFFAMGGPPSPVVVAKIDFGNFVVSPSCRSAYAAGPAIRLKAVADALGPQGLFNPGGDVCSGVLAPAFKKLGEMILKNLEAQCLPAPLVTTGGGLICSADEEVAPGVSCAADCLELAECTVEEVTPGSSAAPKPIPRCPANLAGSDCGASCPCWRLARVPELCSPQQTGSPYALQVLRKTGLLAPFGTHARATCRTTTASWGSEQMANAIQCR